MPKQKTGWYGAQGRVGLNKATVQAYKMALAARGLAASSINQRLSAVRKLAAEAADNGWLDQAQANGIARVRGVKAASAMFIRRPVSSQARPMTST